MLNAGLVAEAANSISDELLTERKALEKQIWPSSEEVKAEPDEAKHGNMVRSYQRALVRRQQLSS
jgi:hypothetical protein